MYKIEIFYSKDDEGYIATIPELPGCSAFGETEEDALREIKIAQELWLETAVSEGREVPEPKVQPEYSPKGAHNRRMIRNVKATRAIKARKQCVLG